MTLEIKMENDTLVGAISGRLDTASSAQFSTDMKPLMDNANKRIILDCTSLDYISSSGLRLLLSLRKQSMAMGGSVVIKGVNNDVKQIFAITGFNTLFEFE